MTQKRVLTPTRQLQSLVLISEYHITCNKEMVIGQFRQEPKILAAASTTKTELDLVCQVEPVKLVCRIVGLTLYVDKSHTNKNTEKT